MQDRGHRLAARFAFPRQFWLLAGGSFVYLIGIETGYPFVTIFMNRVLGVSAGTIGLILGAALGRRCRCRCWAGLSATGSAAAPCSASRSAAA